MSDPGRIKRLVLHNLLLISEGGEFADLSPPEAVFAWNLAAQAITSMVFDKGFKKLLEEAEEEEKDENGTGNKDAYKGYPGKNP